MEICRIHAVRFNAPAYELIGHLKADKAKRSDLSGISGRFGAAVGAPMVVDMRYAHPRLR